MKCPRDAHELVTTRYEAQIDVDQCPACQGMWLDKGELEAVQRTIERDYERELDADTTALEVAHLTDPITCPKCGGEMETREHGYCSQVMVDTCIAGCGVWLDTNELQALEKFYERERREQEWDIVTRIQLSLLSVFARPKRARKA